MTRIEILGVKRDQLGPATSLDSFVFPGGMRYRSRGREQVVSMPAPAIAIFSAILAQLIPNPNTDLYLSMVAEGDQEISVNGLSVGGYIDEIELEKMRVVKKRG